MASHTSSAKHAFEERTADSAAAPEAPLTSDERERLIAAIERGRADLRAGRVTDDEDLTKELDEALGSLG